MERDIEDILAELLERREAGERIDLDDLSLRYPARFAELVAALDRLRGAEARLDAVATHGRQRLGRFRVRGEIARGGMGRVLEAVDVEDPERIVAIKVLDGAAAWSSRARERFHREASILRNLREEGVVRVLDSGVEGSTPWIAMEHVRGETLAAILARARSSANAARPFPPERVAEIGLALARAVGAVHRAGLLHRDIKPGNVILSDEGRVVLVDFGLAHDETAETLTKSGDLLGTPQYMAPEQARGERADERTDVYGIGALLYEFLTLEPPHGFGGGLEILERVRTRAVSRLGGLAGSVPAALERVVLRTLAFRPALRTASADALAADLAAFLEGRAVAARSTGVFERCENWARAHRWAAPLAVAAVLVFAGARFFLGRAQAGRAARNAGLVMEILDAWLDERDEEAALAADELATRASSHAFAALLRSLARDEEPVAGDDPASLACARGLRAASAGDTQAALQALEEAKRLAPQSPVPVVLWARVADRAREHGIAVREYRVAAERLPGSAAVRARLSYAHYALKENAEAEAAIRSALELAPDRGAYHFDLARILYRAGDMAAGLAAAEHGAELSGASASATDLSILAAGLDSQGRHVEAREVLQRVLTQRPEDPRTLYNLGFSFLYDHNLREAVEVFRRIPEGGQTTAGLMSAAWVYAGSNSAECAECREYYAREPDMLDRELAEQYTLEGLHRNDSDETPMAAVRVAKLIGRRTAIEHALEKMQSVEQDDGRIATFERALRSLRSD